MEREKLIAIVTAAQDGDGEALNELFNSFYNDVYFFALKTVKDEDLACDITQETFIEIINTIGDLREPAAFVTWMKKITYHQCTRYFKKKKDILVEEDEDGNSIFDIQQEDRTEFIPDAALDQKDFRETILAMLDELSPEQRAATIMYYYDEMSVKQIAEVQGVSEGTVKSRLNYARKSIKTSVETYEKKNNVKLHSVGFLPLFLWLFQSHSRKTAMAYKSAQAAAAGISGATGASLSVTGVAAEAGAIATGAAVGVTAKLTAIPFAAKVTAVVLAGTVFIGGAGVAVSGSTATEPTVSSPAIQMSEPIESISQTEADYTDTTTIPMETEPKETTAPTTRPMETEPEETTAPTTRPMETEPEETIVPTTRPTETASAETIAPTTVPETTVAVSNYKVPAGAIYKTAEGSEYHAGEAMQATITDGDQLVTADYTYVYIGEWHVNINDLTKSHYEDMLSSINGEHIYDISDLFWGRTNLVDAPAVPSNVRSMKDTFHGCTAIRTAPKLPNSVVNLENAFYGCNSLSVAPDIPSGITSLSGTFYECSSLTAAPAIPSGVTNMNSTFYGCSSLTAAPSLPSGVTSLSETFYGCSSLTAAPAIPSSVTNMNSTFCGCTALAEAPAIPNSVTNLQSAFAGCSSLTAMPTIGTGVTNMVSTFGGCFSLTSITPLPAGVKKLDSCFTACRSLTVAPDIPSSAVSVRAMFNSCWKLQNAPKIPVGITDMSYMFSYCSNMKTAPVIPAGVTDLSNAFDACFALTGTVVIHANPSSYENCFGDTKQPITLTGSSAVLNELAATSANGNITVN